MVCYDAKHGESLSGDNASVVVLIIVGDCQETSQSCNIVKMTMMVVWLAQNCWATRGGLKMLVHLQTLTREQCAYPQRDSCNWINCVGFETYVAECLN